MNIGIAAWTAVCVLQWQAVQPVWVNKNIGTLFCHDAAGDVPTADEKP